MKWDRKWVRKWDTLHEIWRVIFVVIFFFALLLSEIRSKIHLLLFPNWQCLFQKFWSRNEPNAWTTPNHTIIDNGYMNMRQTDYTISKTKLRIDKYSNMLRLAIIVRADVAILIRLQLKCRKCKEDLLKLKARKQHIKSINFNLNAYSNEECLKQFRFFPAEIKKASDIIGFSGGCSARSRYACD